MAGITFIEDPARAATLTGLRRRILDSLDEPDSATGVAAKLGISRQKANYHLRSLEKADLVELAEIRQRRGLEERLMRRTADVVLVDPTAFAGLDLSRGDAVGLSGVIAAAASLIRQGATVAGDASSRGDSVVAATLDTAIRVESPEHLKQMLADLAAVVASYDSDVGLQVRVATNVLPEVAR